MIGELILTLSLSTPMAAVTTGYCAHWPCVSPKWSDGRTASGTPAQPGTCAADWAVYPKGTWLYISGYGICRVEDTGRLIRGNHLDLYFDDIEDARQWGIQWTHIWRVTVKVTTGELERLVEDEMTIGSWAEESFGRPNILAVLRRMCDENLEAMEECVVSNAATRTMFAAMRQGLKHLDNYKLSDDELHKKTPIIAQELADTFIVGYHGSRVLNVEIQSYIQQKMVVNRRRKWKQNSDGTGTHVDEDVILDSIDQEESLT